MIHSRAVILCIWQRLQIFLVTAAGSEKGMKQSEPRLYETSAAHRTVPTPEESAIQPETSALLDRETSIQRSLFWFAAKANLKIIGLIRKIDGNQLEKKQQRNLKMVKIVNYLL